MLRNFVYSMASILALSSLSTTASAVSLEDKFEGTYLVSSSDSKIGEILKIHFFDNEAAHLFYLESGPGSQTPGARCVGKFLVREDLITGKIDHCLNGIGPAKNTFHIRVDKSATYERLSGQIIRPDAQPKNLVELQAALQDAGQYFIANYDEHGSPNGTLSPATQLQTLGDILAHAQKFDINNFPYAEYQWQKDEKTGMEYLRSNWHRSSETPLMGLSGAQLKELASGFRMNFSGFGLEAAGGRIQPIARAEMNGNSSLWGRANAVFIEYDRLLLPQWPDATGLARMKIASGISVPRWKGNTGSLQMGYTRTAEGASKTVADASYIMEEFAHEVGLPALNRCARDVLGDYTNTLLVIHAGTYNPDSSHWNADQLDVVAFRIAGKVYHFQNATLGAYKGATEYVSKQISSNSATLREALSLAEKWATDTGRNPVQSEYYSFWLPFIECMDTRGAGSMYSFSRYRYLPSTTARELRNPETPYDGRVHVPRGDLQGSHISHVHIGLNINEPVK